MRNKTITMLTRYRGTGMTPEDVDNEILAQLADIPRRIYALVSLNSDYGIGAGDVADVLGISDTHAMTDLKRLVDIGLLCRQVVDGAYVYRVVLQDEGMEA